MFCFVKCRCVGFSKALKEPVRLGLEKPAKLVMLMQGFLFFSEEDVEPGTYDFAGEGFHGLCGLKIEAPGTTRVVHVSFYNRCVLSTCFDP